MKFSFSNLNLNALLGFFFIPFLLLLCTAYMNESMPAGLYEKNTVPCYIDENMAAGIWGNENVLLGYTRKKTWLLGYMRIIS